MSEQTIRQREKMSQTETRLVMTDKEHTAHDIRGGLVCLCRPVSRSNVVCNSRLAVGGYFV